MLNLSKKAKADNLDEAIVPADALLGVPDIRNKELGRLYRSIPAGVNLTVIRDSCFSRSGARGLVVYRNVELDIDGRRQGLFTWALFQTLWETPNERMVRTFLKARDLMASQAQAARILRVQEPVLGGSGRMSLGLLGQTPNSNPATAAVVRAVGVDKIRFTGGPATRLFPGCELSGAGKGAAVRVRISKEAGLYESEAEAIAGSTLSDVHLNDLPTWANDLASAGPRP